MLGARNALQIWSYSNHCTIIVFANWCRTVMADYLALEGNAGIFKGKSDMFSGITIDLTVEDPSENDQTFENILKDSLVSYKDCGIRGVWVKIPIQKSSYIPIAVKHGLIFHHCFPSYIMMNTWLPLDEPNKLPTFATSFIGVAGFVVDDDGKLLVVQERFRTLDHWKLPGGMADYKEDIRAAAKREVLEETGINAEFISLVCFRHIPDFRMECSDLYFVCLMKPLNKDIKRDPTEISDAKWMDLEEFLTSPMVHEANKFLAQAYKDQQMKIVCTDMNLYKRELTFYSSELPQPGTKTASSL